MQQSGPLLRHAWLVVGVLAASPAAAADDKALPSGDVVAQRTIHAPADVVYTQLLDLESHESWWPEGCTQKWEFGTTTVGVGANVRLTYRVAMMRRRLTATISEGDPGRYLKLDHAGKRGFATTWTLEAVGEDTKVEVHTWVDPPPWPLTATYMNTIRPAWKECHKGLLDNVARSMPAGG